MCFVEKEKKTDSPAFSDADVLVCRYSWLITERPNISSSDERNAETTTNYPTATSVWTDLKFGWSGVVSFKIELIANSDHIIARTSQININLLITCSQDFFFK